MAQYIGDRPHIRFTQHLQRMQKIFHFACARSLHNDILAVMPLVEVRLKSALLFIRSLQY